MAVLVLWNLLSPCARSHVLAGNSFAFSKCIISSIMALCTGDISEWFSLQEVLYKCLNTICGVIIFKCPLMGTGLTKVSVV